MENDRADAFLRMIQRSRHGGFKVYLGYAAGVGKTWQMLQEGHKLKVEGIDVVIGFVETHGRADTAKLIEGLEVVPRRCQLYRGIALEEMDVDARDQQVLHVLITLGVLTARDVGVGQFVHQGDLGPPGQYRLQVHLFENDTAILHLAPGNDLQPGNEFGRLFAPMGLHQPHDDIDAFLFQAVALLEHLPGFADPGPIA